LAHQKNDKNTPRWNRFGAGFVLSQNIHPRAGRTLLEVAIALGLWLLLSGAVIFAWQYTANNSGRLLHRQSAFENARTAMDVLLMNLQLYDDIRIITHPFTDAGGVVHTDVMQSMSANPYALVGAIDIHETLPNTFFFNAFLLPEDVQYSRINRSGPGNEMVRHIALVQVTYEPRSHITVTITTNCDYPAVITGSTCARYKRVTVNGVSNQ